MFGGVVGLRHVWRFDVWMMGRDGGWGCGEEVSGHVRREEGGMEDEVRCWIDDDSEAESRRLVWAGSSYVSFVEAGKDQYDLWLLVYRKDTM